MVAIFLGAGLLAGNRAAVSASTTSSYVNVQIFATPHNSTLDTFSISAYNLTGGLVASSQSSYPAFSFELPEDAYLFAVTASLSNSYPMPLASSASQAASSGTAIPVKYYNPTEYGFLLTNVTSSRVINISTAPLQNMNASEVTVTAEYVNGSSAAGAYVDASIIGGGYSYYPNSHFLLSGQTGSDGSIKLQVPSVPVQITAWSWLPVNLPQKETTTTVTIGGESVNVTVYWQPTYLGLAGSFLLFPPFHTASITLKAQPSSYWYFPQGAASGSSGSSGSGAIPSVPRAVPANVAANSAQYPSSVTTWVPSTTTHTEMITTTATAAFPLSTSSSTIEGAIIAVAIVIAGACIAVALRRK